MSIVTKQSIDTMLNSENQTYVQTVIGRGLVVIFRNQTMDEQLAGTTQHANGEGFTGADAFSGSMAAKYWLKHHRLEDWMIDAWCRKAANGYSRLAKYHRQLNVAAERKT